MDNSVYQPLSHALNPPTTDPRPPYSHPVQLQNSVEHGADHDPRPDTGVRHEEEEEEDEVEGAVNSSALAEKHSASNQSQPTPVTTRRRPGRPKGSKNKKPRFDVSAVPVQKQSFSTAPLYSYPQQHQLPPPEAAAPTPSQPAPVSPHQSVTAQPAASPYRAPDPSNQALHDFQWRVLSLCSEFYNAADELIRSTPQSILHQCFSLPGNQVDPITLLHEARKACDQLMANPAAVVLKVPAGQHPPGSPAKSLSPPAGAPVISNPGSFVMSLTGTPTQTPQQGAYNPTGSNYQNQSRYPGGGAPYYAYAAQPTPPGPHPYMGQQQVMKPVNLTTPSAAGNQGAWSDEETEKLKQLAEESKKAGGAETGEIDWDWVVNHWGPGRTRHQILIKATNMNMKESSTRATKKRRETEPVHGPTAGDHHASANANNGSASHSPGINGIANASVPNTSTQAVLNAVAAAASSSTSPPNERPASSSVSPVTVHPQQPSAPPAPPGGGNLMHWPVPSPSPVISSGTLASRSVYYPRERNGSKA